MEAWLAAKKNGVCTSYNERLRKGGSVVTSSSMLDRMAAVLGIQPSKMDISSTFQEVGADSIQIIEIQSLIEATSNSGAIPVEKLTKMKVSEVLDLQQKK